MGAEAYRTTYGSDGNYQGSIEATIQWHKDAMTENERILTDKKELYEAMKNQLSPEQFDDWNWKETDYDGEHILYEKSLNEIKGLLSADDSGFKSQILSKFTVNDDGMLLDNDGLVVNDGQIVKLAQRISEEKNEYYIKQAGDDEKELIASYKEKFGEDNYNWAKKYNVVLDDLTPERLTNAKNKIEKALGFRKVCTKARKNV